MALLLQEKKILNKMPEVHSCTCNFLSHMLSGIIQFSILPTMTDVKVKLRKVLLPLITPLKTRAGEVKCSSLGFFIRSREVQKPW